MLDVKLNVWNVWVSILYCAFVYFVFVSCTHFNAFVLLLRKPVEFECVWICIFWAIVKLNTILLPYTL